MFIYKIWHTEKKQAKPTFTQLHGQIVYTIDQWVHSVAIWILVIQNAACKAANGVNNTHRLGNFVAALRRHWRYIEDILFFSCIWLQMYHLVWKLPMLTTFYAIRCHKQQAWTQQTKRAFFPPTVGACENSSANSSPPSWLSNWLFMSARSYIKVALRRLFEF